MAAMLWDSIAAGFLLGPSAALVGWIDHEVLPLKQTGEVGLRPLEVDPAEESAKGWETTETSGAVAWTLSSLHYQVRMQGGLCLMAALRHILGVADDAERETWRVTEIESVK